MQKQITFLMIWVFSWGFSLFSPPERLSVVSPEPGDVLQGVVPIMGSTVISGFKSYEVLFTYDREESKSWFLIQQGNTPVQGGNLAIWDTSTITDGDYRIRILVFLENGQTEELIIKNLHVRNYTPVELSTKKPVEATDVFQVQPSTATVTPTPVLPAEGSLPQNPARLSLHLFSKTLSGGVIFVVVLFLFLGLHFAVQSNRRRRK